MTTQEMIDVLIAYQEGKEIQYKVKASNFWTYTDCPYWNFSAVDYRIKPEIEEKKFRLIREYPLCPPPNTVLEFKTEKDFNDGIENIGEGCSTYYITDCTNHSEFWEEIVKEKEKVYTYKDNLVGRKCKYKPNSFNTYTIISKGTEFIGIKAPCLNNPYYVTYNNFNKYYELC